MAAPAPPLAASPVTPPPAAPRRLPANLQIWIVTLALIIAGAVVGTIKVPSDGCKPSESCVSGYPWLLMLLIIFVFVLFLGKWICDRPLGILVSERNLMSLSRFQMILWTLLILSAYLTMVMERIHAAVGNPLNIAIDPKLWALMGISTASLVGTPLLLESKKRQDPTAQTVDNAAKALNESKSTIDDTRQGKLYSNVKATDARFTDIFQGDDVSNTAYIDPAKLQMFLFTLIVAASYGYQIFHAFYAAPAGLKMPEVDPGMIALLGISHAGYLGSKTAG